MTLAEQKWFDEYNRRKKEITDFKTVNFEENYNCKLYGKFFTSIREKDFNVDIGTLCDITLKGKGIKLARIIGCEKIRFGDLSETTIMIDTGRNYSDALQLFKNLGFDICNFDLEVKYMMFESC
jgi:hypothetical protein